MVEEVGDLNAGVGGEVVALGVQLGLVPGVGQGGVSVVVHAVGGGVALGGEDVVEGVMGVVAHGEVVVAGGEDVPGGAVGVVAGQEVALHGHGEGLALAGGQLGGLVKANQVDGGLLHVVFLLVVAVGGLGVDLHHVLARYVSGVGHLDLHQVAVARGVVGHAQQLLLEGGVAQAVAEGIGHLVGVAPAAAGGGAHAALGIAGAHDGVLIAGLIVLVAHIDALGVDDVVVDLTAAIGDVGAVGVDLVHIAPHLGVITGVGNGGGGEGVDGIGVHGAAGGVDLAGENVGHALKGHGAGIAAQQAGVHAIALQPAQLHGLLGVDDHHDRAEHAGVLLLLEVGHERFLVDAQAQQTVAVGAVESVVVALAAHPGEDHDGRVVVAVLPGGLIGLHVGDGGLDDLGVGGLAQSAVHVLGQGDVHVLLAQDLLHGGVEGHGGDGGDGGGAGGGIVGAVAEDGHLAALSKGQGGVLIAQQHGALLHLEDVFGGHGHLQLQSRLLVGVVSAELAGVVGGVHLGAVVHGDDLTGGYVQSLVDGAGILKHQGGGRDGEQHEEGHQGG